MKQQVLKVLNLKVSYFGGGVLVGAFCFYVGTGFFSNSTLSQKSFKDLAQVELKIRPIVKRLKETHQLDMELVRRQGKLSLVVLDQSLFPINDWRLSKKGFKVFSSLANELQGLKKKINLEVSGHYDSVDPLGMGNAELNKMAISSYRASNVASVFVGAGMRPEQLFLRGKSDKSPLIKDRDAGGHYIGDAGQFNRRLEISFRPEGV